MHLFLTLPAWAGWDDLAADPVATLLADRHTAPGFRIIALSNAAEACVHQHLLGEIDLEEARGCAARMAEAALDPRISPWDSRSLGPLGDHNLYLTHLAIVLAARDRLDPEACDEDQHGRIARHLAARAELHADGLARSFPSARERWPADQAATLYALHRYDQAHGEHLLTEPLARYLRWIERARTPEGLLPNEATGTAKAAEVPRGCAMTWTVRYLAPVAPEVAAGLWAATRESLVVSGIATGVREWPVGHDHAADIDSGPIVNGIGASATAFGIGAARAVGDQATFRALRRTEDVVGWLASADEALAAARDSSLAVALSANQRAITAWEPWTPQAPPAPSRGCSP